MTAKTLEETVYEIVDAVIRGRRSEAIMLVRSIPLQDTDLAFSSDLMRPHLSSDRLSVLTTALVALDATMVMVGGHYINNTVDAARTTIKREMCDILFAAHMERAER
jgi:hypothetical protein